MGFDSAQLKQNHCECSMNVENTVQLLRQIGLTQIQSIFFHLFFGNKDMIML